MGDTKSTLDEFHAKLKALRYKKPKDGLTYEQEMSWYMFEQWQTAMAVVDSYERVMFNTQSLEILQSSSKD